MLCLKPGAMERRRALVGQLNDRETICCSSLLVATPLNSADRAIASSNDSSPAASRTFVSVEALRPAIDEITAVVVTTAVVAGAANIYADSHTTGASTNINILR